MRELRSVLWMAYKDLCHDIRMSLCLVLTVAAIALPLLLFFGLKNGVVEVMRQRMINDPSFMEIIPQGSLQFDATWFDTWRNNPHVAFLVPRTRELGVSGAFQNMDTSNTHEPVRADMQPTGQGDWLLKSYDVPIPENDFCVLTNPLAQKLHAQVGNHVELTINRQKKGGGFESANRMFTVCGILPAQASGQKMAFVPLEQIENVEAFRDGFAVPEYDWAGEKALAYPVFYSALLYTKEKLSPVTLAQIKQRTGFIYAEEVSTLEDGAVQDWQALRLSTGNSPIHSFKIQGLRNLLRGLESVFIPLAGKKDQGFELSLASGQALSGQLRSTPLWASPLWQGDIAYSENLDSTMWQDTEHSPMTMLLPSSYLSTLQSNTIQAQISVPDGEHLTLSLSALPYESSHQATNTSITDKSENTLCPVYVAPGLLGRLNLLLERPLIVAKTTEQSPHETDILLGRQNYSRFRMYARSLDDVAPLAQQLEKHGLVVKTHVADIERVQHMDSYLSLILGLIAVAAMGGGAICLLASLYANVERKQKAFAVLRLLGIHGTTLCAFPLTSGLLITSLGLSLSLIFFHAVSFYINMLAQEFTLSGEVLCHLDVHHQIYAMVWSLLAALLAGSVASLRLTRIQAADGLRDE